MYNNLEDVRKKGQNFVKANDIEMQIEGDESQLPITSAEMKNKLIMRELSKCINHFANSYKNDKEKYAFIARVKSLHHLLLSSTPAHIRKKTEELAEEYKRRIEEETRNIGSEEEKEKRRLEILMEFAEILHYQNIQIIDNSKMMEEEIEGQIDVSDEEFIKAVRQGGEDVDARPVSLVP